MSVRWLIEFAGEMLLFAYNITHTQTHRHTQYKSELLDSSTGTKDSRRLHTHTHIHTYTHTHTHHAYNSLTGYKNECENQFYQINIGSHMNEFRHQHSYGYPAPSADISNQFLRKHQS